jgi:hypothetical protein
MDNPQAFPVWVNDAEYSRGGYVEGGMSLRDYFAAKILQTVVTSWGLYVSGSEELCEKHRLEQAKAAYDYADAMLKARGE